jgi:hypothetical protein
MTDPEIEGKTGERLEGLGYGSTSRGSMIERAGSSRQDEVREGSADLGKSARKAMAGTYLALSA